MTSQQLKNSILQMAVQGLLVPQDPNDEPASVLLQRIREEKQKLVKEGKIKKEKHSSVIFRGSDNLPYESRDNSTPVCIAEQLPFDIPDSWEWARLGEVLNKLTDGTHFTPTYVEKGIPFLSVKDISSGAINFDSVKYISPTEHYQLYSRCDPQKGDILLTKVGTTGIPVLVNTDTPFSLFVSVALLKFNDKFLDPKYLIFVLKSPLVQVQCAEKTKGVGNKNWVVRDIAQTIISIPPLEEQRRIVAKLEELLPLVEEYGKAESTLTALNATFPEALKKSILQDAVQGKLVPQDPDEEPASVLLERIRREKNALEKGKKGKRNSVDSRIVRRDNSYYELRDGVERCIDEFLPFEIPESWEWARLGEVASVNGGYAFKSVNFIETGVRVVRISDFNETGFVCKKIVRHPYSDSLEEFLLREEDILLCMTGGTVGKSLFVEKLHEPMLVNQRVATIRAQTIDKKNLFYTILTSSIQRIIDKEKNSTNDNISIDLIKSFMIPIPPLEEQRRIVAKIEELLKQVETLK